MPAGFTKSLADHLNTQTKHAVTEAIDGDTLVAGKFLLAPGDYHMVIEPCLAGNKVRLNQDPPENYCRPAVDPMLRSVAKIYGASALTVILTGMGQDGLEGCKVIHKTGVKFWFKIRPPALFGECRAVSIKKDWQKKHFPYTIFLQQL